MSTFTLRIDAKLKARAAKEAAKMGIPLTHVVKNALIQFVESPKVVVGEPQAVIVDEAIQRTMDKIAKSIK